MNSIMKSSIKYNPTPAWPKPCIILGKLKEHTTNNNNNNIAYPACSACKMHPLFASCNAANYFRKFLPHVPVSS